MSPTTKIFRYATFNLPALITHAESLRSARCSCDISQEPMSGSHNWAIVLAFDDDGGDWIFRSPRPDSGFSELTTLKMIEREVASIQVSKLNDIPVVEIKSYWQVIPSVIYINSSSLTIRKRFSISRIWSTLHLATRAPGFSISSKFIWDPYPEGTKQPRYPLPCLSKEAKEKIMKQLGTITSQILKQSWDKIGSLRRKDDKYHVEECLSRALTWPSLDTFDDIPRGPFHNEKD